MTLIRVATIALAASVAAGAAFAQSDKDDGKNHHWQKPDAAQMAAWHQRMCTDRYAMAAGRLAFVEAKVGITQQQRQVFDAWRDAVLSNASARQQACLAHTPEMGRDGHKQTALDREAMAERMLSDRLRALQAQRPALEQLYQSLSPEQKVAFDESASRRGFHHHGRGHFGDHGSGQRNG